MQSGLKLVQFMNNKKKKERFETILEPFQAILQIGFLSYCPIGTKLTINNNILYLQLPTYTQSVVRWYNNDTQEDLFYLFNIFYRFKKFYHFLNEDKKNEENKKLYDLLIQLAINGISNLIRTYNQTDKIHILHTLHMYKGILEGTGNPINEKALEADIFSNNKTAIENVGRNSEGNKSNKNKLHRQAVIEDETKSIQLNQPSFQNMNIDDVFIHISELYNQELYNIIYNALQLMEKNELENSYYIEGINKILEPYNKKIKKWIDDHIIF